MKLIRTEDAVGCVLCHDLTQIIKGVTKDAVFRKGHVVRPEDIPVLLSIGKDNLYVWEADENMLHENDAARILCDLCKNEGMVESEAKEGKIDWLKLLSGLEEMGYNGVFNYEVSPNYSLEEIKENFPCMDVMYDHLSMGISCHTGEGAMGIGIMEKMAGL